MKHRWLIVVPNYWGTGPTENVARAQCLDAGASKKAVDSGPALLFHFTHEAEWGPEDDQAFCYVDNYGTTHWQNMELAERVELNLGDSNGKS